MKVGSGEFFLSVGREEAEQGEEKYGSVEIQWG